MASYRTVPIGQEDDMPKVIQVPLPEGVDPSKHGTNNGDGSRLPLLDPEALYMVAWINCRRRHEVARELRNQRVQFLVRLAAL